MSWTSYRTKEFVKAFEGLPQEIKESATEQFKMWRENPTHLPFKHLIVNHDIISSPINSRYRSLGVSVKDKKDNSQKYVWFWVGSHSDYNNLLKNHHITKTVDNIRRKYLSGEVEQKTQKVCVTQKSMG